MNRLLFFICVLFCMLTFAQNNPNLKEIEKIENYINSGDSKDKHVAYFYRLDSNSAAIDEKTLNNSNKAGDWDTMYLVYKRNGKVVSIKKAYPGSSHEEYQYYFNNNGKIIGASKSISFVSGSNDCSWFATYYTQYVFNFNSGDWEKGKTEIYNYDSGNRINIDSPKCSNVKKDLKILVSHLESTNRYPDLKSFLIGNKINL